MDEVSLNEPQEFAPTEWSPSVSAVIPTYNVAEYLPDFLESLGRQQELSAIELIFVDDGSTDDSRDLISERLPNFPSATLVSQPNGGLSSARNLGISHATGEWITFPDPDDFLGDDYFANLLSFIHSPKAKKTDLIATNLLILNEEGDVTDRHPLRFRFAKGDQAVDLDRHPRFIHLSAATGCYNLNLVRELNLTFNVDIRPNFEDGDFTSRYLLACTAPRIQFLANSIYYYRRRLDGSSLVQKSWTNEEKYSVVPRIGYLTLLQDALDSYGHIPPWLANIVLYDILQYFKTYDHKTNEWTTVPAAAIESFHESVTQILRILPNESLYGFDVVHVEWRLRQALALGYGLGPEHTLQVNLEVLDTKQELVRCTYLFTGELPREEFRVRGHSIHALYSKSRPLRRLGKTLCTERILWLPSDGTIGIKLDDRQTPLALGPDDGPMFNIGPTALHRQLSPRPSGTTTSTESGQSVAPTAIRRPSFRKPSLPTEQLRWLSERALPNIKGFRRRHLTAPHVWSDKFDGAWILVHGPDPVANSSIAFYRYLTIHQPHVNAWLAATQPEVARRLASDGFNVVEMDAEEFPQALRAAELVGFTSASPSDRWLKSLRQFPQLDLVLFQDDPTKSLNERFFRNSQLRAMITKSALHEVDPDSPITSKEHRSTGLPRDDGDAALSFTFSSRAYYAILKAREPLSYAERYAPF